MSRKKQKFRRWWRRYGYKHTTLAALTTILFILLIDSALLGAIFGFVERWGYVGGFLAGILSVSFFTAIPAVVLILDLALKLEPHWLALMWGLGSTIGDWIILRLYEEKVVHELRPLFKRFGLKHAVRLLRHRFTSWILFLVGAVFIASPLPDEVGLGLMGLSHLKRRYVIFMCFLLNFAGALTIILAARAIGV